MEERQNWMKPSERKRSIESGLIQPLSRESPVMRDFQLRTPIPRHGVRIPAVLMKSARLTLVAALNANVGLDLDDPANVLLARVRYPSFIQLIFFPRCIFTTSTFCISESRSYNIEVVTTSESREEITVVRLSPKAVERGLQETLRKNFKVCRKYIFNLLSRFLHFFLCRTSITAQKLLLSASEMILNETSFMEVKET